MLLPRSQRSVTLSLVIVGLTLLANYLFTGECVTRFGDLWELRWGPAQSAATFCLVLAMGLAVFLFGRGDDFHVPSAPAAPTSADAGDQTSLKSFVPFLCLYCGALFLYVLQGENSAVRWLWLLGMGALLVPLVRGVKFSALRALPFAEYMLLLAVVAVGFVVRYNDLADLPYHIDNDVSIMGLFSKSLVANNDWRWIGMAPTDHQYSEHQYIAICMRLFGVNGYGVAMRGVLAGTASIGAIYFFGKIAFNRWVGLIAATFLAFNYVHIHFSRIIFGPLSTLFLVVALAALVHGLRRACKLSFALGGLSLGAGLLSYYSARVGPLVALGALSLWLFQRRKYPDVTWSHWLIGMAGVLAAFGPNLVFALAHFDSFRGRGNEVMIWTNEAWNHLSAKYSSHGSGYIVWMEQLKRTLLSPFYYPDESTICYLRKPMLGGFTAICFVFGLGYCLRRWREVMFGLPLFWVGFTFLLGGVLTIDPPFWPHLNIAVPALVLIAAVGAERLCRRIILSGGRKFVLFAPAALGVLLVGFGIHNWEVYSRFASVFATARTHAIRQIQQLSPDYKVYLIGQSIRWEQEVFQFLAAGVDGQNLSTITDAAQLPPINRPTAYFVFSDADPVCAKVLMKAYPWARRRQFFDGWDSPAFTIFQVSPPGYIEQPQRARAPAPSIWSLPGWRYLSVGIVIVLGFGWFLLQPVLAAGRMAQRRIPASPVSTPPVDLRGAPSKGRARTRPPVQVAAREPVVLHDERSR